MTASDASTGARTLASAVGRRMRGQQVIDEQLQTSFALVLVHLEPVHELQGTRGRRERRAVGEMVEGDRIEAAAAARRLHPHLHMPLADHPRVAHAEEAVEAGLGERLAPGTA